MKRHPLGVFFARNVDIIIIGTGGKDVIRLRLTNVLIFIIALVVFIGIFLFDISEENHQAPSSPQVNDSGPSKKSLTVSKGSVGNLIGAPETKVVKQYGQPDRKDPSRYGYQWWIYGRGSEKYMQIGMNDGQVVTVFALGKEVNTQPFKIGAPSSEILKYASFSDSLSLKYKGEEYEFEFKEEDLMLRPLIKFNDHWVQLYFNHSDERLLGIRFLSTGVLIRQRPYTLVYKGQLEQPPKLPQKQWKAVNQARARQVMDITNILRHRFGLEKLARNKKAAQAAYLHSVEMEQKNYFSHDSKWQGDLGDRLKTQKVSYKIAGENIASHYIDAAAVVHGWMNSEDHRKNILNDDFTELGVGVYHNFYTQDFLTPRQ